MRSAWSRPIGVSARPRSSPPRRVLGVGMAPQDQVHLSSRVEAFHQRLLRRNGAGPDAMVLPSLRSDQASLRVVQVGDQAFVDDALAQRRVAHRPGDLDAAEHVAAHPVGARQVERLLVRRRRPSGSS